MNKEIRSIEELADCRAAFADNPTAVYAWCCHHEILIEPCTNPEERIAYVLDNKDVEEQACRFRNFRPVRVALPRAYEEAYKAYDEAWKTHDEARKAYDEARKAHDEARKAHDEAWKAYVEKLQKLHDQDWPDNTWNGRSIFA